MIPAWAKAKVRFHGLCPFNPAHFQSTWVIVNTMINYEVWPFVPTPLMSKGSLWFFYYAMFRVTNYKLWFNTTIHITSLPLKRSAWCRPPFLLVVTHCKNKLNSFCYAWASIHLSTNMNMSHTEHKYLICTSY